jgi:hypothetical protein
MSCPGLDVLAAYCANELPETDAATLEDHYFACDLCLGRLERMRALVDRLEAMLPHVLTPDRRRRLEARGEPLAVTHVAPGEHGTITLGRGTELGLWVMQAPLGAAEQVDFELHTQDGAPLLALADVPFDRERQEIVLACQSSYRELSESAELVARIRMTDSAGAHMVSEYFLDQVFDSP